MMLATHEKCTYEGCKIHGCSQERLLGLNACPHEKPSRAPNPVTTTRYRNAGRTKIYDDAMFWILVGFVLFPYDGLRFQVWGLRQGYGVVESFGVWPWLWKRQMDVWKSL